MKKIFLIIFFLVITFNISSCDKECKHNYETTVYKQTCEKDGYTEYHCLNCGDTYIDDIVRTKGHQTIVTKKGYPATCTTPGLTDEVSCVICEMKIEEQVTTAPLEHMFITWQEVKAPTLLEDGKLQSICLHDKNHVEIYVLPALSKNNNIYQYNVLNPTCTKEGLETYQFSMGKQTFVYEVILDKLPHEYKSDVTLPTCVDKGYTTYTCNCGDTYIDNYVKENGHSYDKEVTLPTCIKEGYTTYTCHCGDTYTADITEKIPHEYMTEIIEPTCTKEGYTLHKCNCGDSYQDTFTEKIPHDYKSEIILPTCEEDGYTLHKCNCGDYYQDNYVDKLEHKYGEYNLKLLPSATSEGALEKVCEHDNSHVITYILPVLSNQNYSVITTNPTHEDNGENLYKITIEGKEYSFEEVIEALGHNYQTTIILPQCEELGYTIYVCDCGKTYTGDFVEPLGHSENILIQGVNPTCKEGGYTSKIECRICHKIIQEQVDLPIGTHQDLSGDGYCDSCDVIVGKDITYIKSYEDLQKVNDNLSGRYQLLNDIDITGTGFVGIGSDSSPFTGYFYGNNFSIIGFEISNKDGALFYNNSGTIDSLVLENVSVTSDNKNATMGLLTCFNSGTIKNCIIKGNNKITSTVSHKDFKSYPYYDGGTYSYSSIFGAFSAKNSDLIEGCSMQGSLVLTINNSCVYELKTPWLGYIVNGEDMQTNQTITFGVISGVNTGNVVDSNVTGTVTSIYNITAEKVNKYGLAIAYTTAYVGAFIGDNQGTINNCSSTLIKVTDNVTASNYKPSNVAFEIGIKCNLTKNYDSNYTQVIGKNTGIITNLTFK